MNVLNKELYSALLSKFKKVKIHNQGQPYTGQVCIDPYTNKSKVYTINAGEYYAVCCPFCGDKRFRLWINHRWHTLYEGVVLDHLVVCYNEHCEATPEFNKFAEMVFDNTTVLTVVSSSNIVYEDTISYIPLQSQFTPLSALLDDHPAIKFLNSRNYSIKELEEVWNVQWCTYSTVMPLNNRLFFPLYAEKNGEWINHGGQSRWVDGNGNGTPPDKKEPKWWTFPGTKKSQCLYGMQYAINQHDIIVICEGPFDVIRTGSKYAVGLLGKSPSNTQRKLLWDHWGSKNAVAIMALDPDTFAEKQTLDFINWLKTWPGGCVIFDASPYKDIGDMPSELIWERIHNLWENCISHQQQ